MAIFFISFSFNSSIAPKLTRFSCLTFFPSLAARVKYRYFLLVPVISLINISLPWIDINLNSVHNNIDYVQRYFYNFRTLHILNNKNVFFANYQALVVNLFENN